MRLFVAIHPDPSVHAWIADTQRRLRRELSRFDREIRWVPPEGVHVTLAFLGELPDPAPVEQALENCRVQLMELAVDRYGVFPGLRRPAVLWAGVADNSGRLARLQAEVSFALAAFVEPERRPFVAHLTLARLKPTPRLQLGEAFATHLSGGCEPPVPWSVDSFSLMRSETGPSGTRYSTLRSFSAFNPLSGVSSSKKPRKSSNFTLP